MAEFVTNSVFAVGAASVLVSPPCAAGWTRAEVVITNTSAAAQTVTVSFGKYAIVNQGILLQPYSAYYASASENFFVSGVAIYCAASAAAGQISLFERRKEGR